MKRKKLIRLTPSSTMVSVDRSTNRSIARKIRCRNVCPPHSSSA